MIDHAKDVILVLLFLFVLFRHFELEKLVYGQARKIETLHEVLKEALEELANE